MNPLWFVICLVLATSAGVHGGWLWWSAISIVIIGIDQIVTAIKESK